MPTRSTGSKKHTAANKISKSNNPVYQAQNILSRRDHSEYEVRAKLQRKGFTPDQTDQAIAWLKEHQLLNDAAFAQSFITDAIRFKAVGPRWLIHKLRQKGIAAEIIEPAVYEVLDETKEIELVRLAAEQWRKSHSKYRDDRQRLTRFLFSRGFSSDVVVGLLES